MWGRFDIHKQNAHLGFLDCSVQHFQVEKEVIMRKTMINDSLMLVRLTTLLTTSLTVLNRKNKEKTKVSISIL